MQRSARLRQQRPPQAAAGEIGQRLHRRQAIRAGRAQRTQQEGLGLVVAVLRQRQPFAGLQRLREGLAPCLPRRRLQAIAAVARHLHPHHLQRHRQRVAHGCAMRGPGIGIGMQAVVHVQRTQAGVTVGRLLREQVQQHGRIQPAAEAEQQRRRRRIGQCGGECGQRGRRGMRRHRVTVDASAGQRETWHGEVFAPEQRCGRGFSPDAFQLIASGLKSLPQEQVSALVAVPNARSARCPLDVGRRRTTTGLPPARDGA